MIKISSPFLVLSLLLFHTPLFAQPEKPKMLVVDYAMGYPEENAGVMSVFTEAGYEVHYRQYYPSLVGADANAYDAILLMGGGDPGMSLQEVDLAINFVSRGKLLILAAPPDSEYGGDRRTNAGMHDRYMFNRILNRLNISMYAYAPPVDKSVVLTPVVAYDPISGHETARGLNGPVGLRADTRVLVGDGVMPLLLEPEPEEGAETVAEAEPEAREVKMVRRRVRVLPGDALPDEEIELLLRGANRLQPLLHYRSGREPVPVAWNTQEFGGRVVSVGADTITVRVSGNRWGSEYAIVDVPSSVVAIAFVRREMPEEIDSNDAEEVVLTETGRMAVMAVGRADRLDKGFVALADRRLLNTLSAPTTPVSLTAADLPDPTRAAQFLTQAARYLKALAADPDTWAPDNPHPKARIPGVREPDFSVNTIEILQRVPERVTVTTNQTMPSDLTETGAAPQQGTPIRGVWDYIVRTDDRTDSLLTLLTTQDYNFFWTVAQKMSFTDPDSMLMEAMRFGNWGRRIASRLSGSSVDWFVGVTLPDEMDGDYTEAVDARGSDVDMPSLFDLSYWEKEVLAPSKALAEFGRMNPALKGIIHDWETHINRFNWSYSSADAFQDDNFRQFVRYLAGHGWYDGGEFDTFKGLGKKKRFEWLLKSGRLEMYFTFLEQRAEKLGRLYRESIHETNANLRHGGFMRSPRLSWFYLGFWRGLSEPNRPLHLLTYEQPPAWYFRFIADRGITARMAPVALLGLIPTDAHDAVLREASARDGYVLERGIWLVSEPEGPDDITAPQR